MRFYKYHGAGNDFVLVENLNGEIEEEAKPELARTLCERHFGVGGDGLLLVERSGKADARFRYFNSDGSEAEMCGNGMRCFAKHLYDFGIVRKERMRIETLAGVIGVRVFEKEGKVEEVEVELGAPRLAREEIPALGEGRFLRERLRIDGEELEVSAVNTGVPHAWCTTSRAWMCSAWAGRCASTRSSPRARMSTFLRSWRKTCSRCAPTSAALRARPSPAARALPPAPPWLCSWARPRRRSRWRYAPVGARSMSRQRCATVRW